MLESLPTLKTGHRLQHRYQILKKLGSGGYGSVYLAEDTRLPGRKVAIKELNDPSPAAQKLFRQEAVVLAQLNHPGLVQVSDFFGAERSYYLVMDYVEGRDLLDIAIEAEKQGNQLPVSHIIDWGIQVCESLAYLHNQVPPILHRDIKPDNIRLGKDGRVILVDFGIAKIDPSSSTQLMAKAISQGFSPPEQYDGGTRTDKRADVYALGATLYCLLTLKPPPDSFERLMNQASLVSPQRFNSQIQTSLERIILRAMELNRLNRYEDAGEMLVALRRTGGKLLRRRYNLTSNSAEANVHIQREIPEPPPAIENSKVLCPNCGSKCRCLARFCPHCGFPLKKSTSRKICPRCGAENRANARFCSECRTSLYDSGDSQVSLQTGRVYHTPAPAGDPQWHSRQGRRALQNKNFAEAIHHYEQAKNKGVQTSSLYENLARGYIARKEFAKAVSLLEKGIQQHRGYAGLYLQLALAYLGTRQLAQALPMLETAHRLAPEDIQVTEQLAKTYLKIGRQAKAIPLLEYLTQLAPDNFEYQHQLALSYLLKNNVRKAEDVFRNLRQDHSQSKEVQLLNGVISLRRKKYQLAIRIFRELIQREYQYSLAHYFIGEVYFENERWEDAIGAYQNSAFYDSRNADPHIKMCMCYMALGKNRQGAEALQRALTINPFHPLALEIVQKLSW
jgi:eukaryotic-like serine/threonine-protein kinase